ncbi:MAG: metallopeptidase family protein [Pseudomonadota bacterium]
MTPFSSYFIFFPNKSKVLSTFFSIRKRKIHFNLDQFKELVTRSLQEIPKEFLEYLENLEIIVEEEPSPEVLQELGLGKEDLLFGLYQGIPRPEKSTFQGVSLPDRITLFRRPILSSCRSKQEILDQIRKTLVHEMAHHFGFPEKRIRQLGY